MVCHPVSSGEPTRFAIGMAEKYAREVQEHPRRFSWEQLAENLRIQIRPSAHWNRSDGQRQVRLEAVAVRSDSVVSRAAAENFSVVADGTPLNAQGLPVEHSQAGGRLPGDPQSFGDEFRALAREASLGFEKGDRFYAPFAGDLADPLSDQELARTARGRDVLILYLDYAQAASHRAAITEPMVFLQPGL